MKTLALLGVVALAIACDSPTSPRAPLKAPTTASNAVVFNESVERAAVAINDCNGQLLFLTVRFHDVFALTFDAAGGFHLKVHEDSQGRGTIPVTGPDYLINGTFDDEINATAGVEQTIALHFNLLSKGKAPNEVANVDLHITVTPNGDVSSFHDHFRLMCQGS